MASTDACNRGLLLKRGPLCGKKTRINLLPPKGSPSLQGEYKANSCRLSIESPNFLSLNPEGPSPFGVAWPAFVSGFTWEHEIPRLLGCVMHRTGRNFLTEHYSDPHPSSFLRIVSFGCLRRPAVLVHAGVVVDCRVFKCQLAFRTACRTDCACRCAACHAPRSAAWPRDLAAQLGRVELRQNALDCCPLVDGRFILRIPGG